MNPAQTWRKSSRSQPDSMCVELSVGPTHTSIRDTKNRIAGTLTLPSTTFSSFLRSLQIDR